MTADNLRTPGRSAVLSLGRLYCDLIFTGAPGLPVLGREVFAQGLQITAGGGALITAAHLAQLGRPACVLARLGHDALSQAIEPLVTGSGVDTRFLERSDEAGPQATVATILGDERAFLSKRAGSARPATLEAALGSSDVAHLHIAEYATLHEMPDLIERAKAAGLTISLDPSWDETLISGPDLLQNAKGVDLFMPNLEEAAAITGLSDPAAALQLLAGRFPVVALKAGANGAWGAQGGQTAAQPAEQVDAVDTTGAGDAFNAGFINAWLAGGALSQSLAAGVARGSLSVQSVGGLPRA